jgi:hypothetical protein
VVLAWLTLVRSDRRADARIAAETSRTTGVVEVDELLKHLKLSDAERDGVFLAKADRGDLPKVKRMAVARLLTVKGFSEQSLEKTMSHEGCVERGEGSDLQTN